MKVRKVIGRERGTTMYWLNGGYNDGKPYDLSGTDVLECYHEVGAYGNPLALRRYCRQCGSTCDCHLCQVEQEKSKWTKTEAPVLPKMADAIKAHDKGYFEGLEASDLDWLKALHGHQWEVDIEFGGGFCSCSVWPDNGDSPYAHMSYGDYLAHLVLCGVGPARTARGITR